MALPRLLWGPPFEGPRRPRVLLGCSGSVATIKVPAIAQQLEQRGACVVVVPTRSALHFLRATVEAEAAHLPETEAPHLPEAAAGATVIDCARPELSKTLGDKLTCHLQVPEKSGGREGTGVDGGCDSDLAQCNSEGGLLGLDKLPELNRVQESDDRIGIKENNCVEERSGVSVLSQCCTKASGRLTSDETDSLTIKCSCANGFCKCAVVLANTVQTQTDIAGVTRCFIQDSVIPNNSEDINNFKTNYADNPISSHGARMPSQCLSCLQMLESTELGSFASQTSATASEGTSRTHESPRLASGDTTTLHSSAGLLTMPPSCDWCSTQRLLPGLVIAGDALEWEGWRGRGDPVLHIDLRRWADLCVIAPLSANTLAKLANGLCDNLLTCVTRAWDTKKPLLFCPAMNTHMYEHPFTGKQITALTELGYVEVPAVCKRLVCGDVGGGAMAEVNTIVEAVWGALQQPE